MKTLIFISFSLLPLFTMAQGFEKIISTFEDEYFTHVSELETGEFVAVGRRGNVLGNDYKVIIIKLDQYGNVLLEKEFKSDQYAPDYISSIVPFEGFDFKYILLGGGFGSAAKPDLYIGCIDENFDLVKETVYSEPDFQFSVYGHFFNLNNDLMITGAKNFLFNPNIEEGYIGEITAEGSLKWIKSFPEFEYSIIGVVEVPHEDKYHLFGVFNYRIGIVDKTTLQIDTIFGYQYPPEFPDFGRFRTPKYLFDRGWIAIPFHVRPIQPDGEDDIAVAFVNSKYEKQGSITIGKPGFAETLSGKTLDYIYPDKMWLTAISTIGFPSVLDFDNKDAEIGFYRFDTKGNLAIQKFFGGDAYYFPYVVTATRDGGAIVAGSRFDWRKPGEPERDMVLIKVDSLGNSTSRIDEPGINGFTVEIFPNPAGEKLWIAFSSPFKEDFNLTFFNVIGKPVFTRQLSYRDSKTEISLQTLPSGIYWYQLKDKFGKILKSGKQIIVRS